MDQFNQIHAQMIVSGMSRDAFPASRLLKFTTATLDTPHIPLTNLILSQIQGPDVYSYNLMIRAFSLSCHPLTSLSLYHNLLFQGLHPNEYTLCFLLTCCANAFALREGRQVHVHLIKHGFEHRVFAATSLIHMYGNCQTLPDALQLFEEMPQRSEVTWGAMIDACVAHGELIKGLQLLVEMSCLRVEASNATLVTALCACGEMGDFGLGRMIHAYIEIRGLEHNVTLGTSLVDMYAKCGAIDMAMEVFHAIPEKSAATWNCMIHGLSMNSRAGAALNFFGEMQRMGVRPNAATFVGVLHACSHAGLVRDGIECFYSMSEKYSLVPNIKHYGCMVDLFSRAGRLEEALEVIRKMPIEPDVVIWGALFGACRIHGNTMLGELIGAQIIKLQPHHTGGYTFLSDMYAMAKRWDNVFEVRGAMMEMDMRKTPGCSFISD